MVPLLLWLGGGLLAQLEGPYKEVLLRASCLYLLLVLLLELIVPHGPLDRLVRK